MECEPREDRHLRRRVLAVHVLGRVGLRVAELLRALQHVRVGGARPRHLAEDEVGGSVHDAVHLLDVRAGERLPHHADHRDDARDGGLVAQLRRAGARRGEQLVAVLREQLLVGGHQGLARLQRAQRVLPRGLDAADQLDDRVGGLEDLVERSARARQHPRDLGPAAGGRGDRVGALGEQRVERRPHRAVTEQADAERRGRHASRAARSS